MRIAILDGARIPFQQSGTVYKKLMAYDMVNACFGGLLKRNSDAVRNHVDLVNVGTVMQEVKTSNIARESAIKCGISASVPAETVTQACISSSRALCSSAETIMAGNASLALVGGVETFSDLPIRHSRKMRQYLMTLPKEMKKGVLAGLKHTAGLGIADFSPELPAIANFTTGEVMGATSEKIATRYNVSREEQDAFAVRSHELAYKAHKNGLYKGEIIEFMNTRRENNIREGVTVKDLGRLRPSFVKKDGTHTAGNSSGLTDGATGCLISSEAIATQLNVKPIGYLKSWVFTGTDPYKEMLLGPAYAIPKLLAKNGLTLGDIDVFEIHEAFAGQILANLRALEANKVGIVPEDKLNLWGGSLAIGHPLGASNIRNVVTACNRLKHEGGRYALVSACADGGLASALLIDSNN
ncbi:MAG: thiolase family protein [Vampirovibrionia bacterium]